MREQYEPQTLGLTRLEAVSDGVFGVALTLLLVEVKIPAALTAEAWKELWPHFAGYAVSFVLIATYWVAHNNEFRYIKRSLRAFLWLNFLFLAGITLVPFSTMLLGNFMTSETRSDWLWGRFSEQQVAVILYGFNLILVGAALELVWIYAVRRDLLYQDADLPPDIRTKFRYEVQETSVRNLFPPLVYILAIAAACGGGVAFSLVLYIATPLVYLALPWIKRALRRSAP